MTSKVITVPLQLRSNTPRVTSIRMKLNGTSDSMSRCDASVKALFIITSPARRTETCGLAARTSRASSRA